MVWETTSSAARFVACCFVLWALAGCRPSNPQSTVFCAASLTGVAQELSGSSGARIHSGGSKNLVSQFQSGARADLLLLADASLVDKLPANQIDRHAILAGNRLVLARQRGRSVEATALEKTDTVLALADPQLAPLGHYSRQALSKVPVSARTVYLKDATAVLTALRLGHADLGVIYSSDLQNWSETEEVTGLSLEHHDPIRYVAVLVKAAHPDARNLYETLTSHKGRQALEKAGFSTR